MFTVLYPGYRQHVEVLPMRIHAVHYDGGNVCESNTPKTFFTPHNGFEDRGAHQDSSTPVIAISTLA